MPPKGRSKSSLDTPISHGEQQRETVGLRSPLTPSPAASALSELSTDRSRPGAQPEKKRGLGGSTSLPHLTPVSTSHRPMGHPRTPTTPYLTGLPSAEQLEIDRLSHRAIVHSSEALSNSPRSIDSTDWLKKPKKKKPQRKHLVASATIQALLKRAQIPDLGTLMPKQQFPLNRCSELTNSATKTFADFSDEEFGIEHLDSVCVAIKSMPEVGAVDLSGLKTPPELSGPVFRKLLDVVQHCPKLTELVLGEECIISPEQETKIQLFLLENQDRLDRKAEAKKIRKEKLEEKKRNTIAADLMDFYYWENSNRLAVQLLAQKGFKAIHQQWYRDYDKIMRRLLRERKFAEQQRRREQEASDEEKARSTVLYLEQQTWHKLEQQLLQSLEIALRTQFLTDVKETINTIHVQKVEDFIAAKAKLRNRLVNERSRRLGLFHEQKRGRQMIQAEFLAGIVGAMMRHAVVWRRWEEYLAAKRAEEQRVADEIDRERQRKTQLEAHEERRRQRIAAKNREEQLKELSSFEAEEEIARKQQVQDEYDGTINLINDLVRLLKLHAGLQEDFEVAWKGLVAKVREPIELEIVAQERWPQSHFYAAYGAPTPLFQAGTVQLGCRHYSEGQWLESVNAALSKVKDFTVKHNSSVEVIRDSWVKIDRFAMVEKLFSTSAEPPTASTLLRQRAVCGPQSTITCTVEFDVTEIQKTTGADQGDLQLIAEYHYPGRILPLGQRQSTGGVYWETSEPHLVQKDEEDEEEGPSQHPEVDIAVPPPSESAAARDGNEFIQSTQSSKSQGSSSAPVSSRSAGNKPTPSTKNLQVPTPANSGKRVVAVLKTVALISDDLEFEVVAALLQSLHFTGHKKVDSLEGANEGSDSALCNWPGDAKSLRSFIPPCGIRKLKISVHTQPPSKRHVSHTLKGMIASTSAPRTCGTSTTVAVVPHSIDFVAQRLVWKEYNDWESETSNFFLVNQVRPPYMPPGEGEAVQPTQGGKSASMSQASMVPLDSSDDQSPDRRRSVSEWTNEDAMLTPPATQQRQTRRYSEASNISDAVSEGPVRVVSSTGFVLSGVDTADSFQASPQSNEATTRDDATKPTTTSASSAGGVSLGFTAFAADASAHSAATCYSRLEIDVSAVVGSGTTSQGRSEEPLKCLTDMICFKNSEAVTFHWNSQIEVAGSGFVAFVEKGKMYYGMNVNQAVANGLRTQPDLIVVRFFEGKGTAENVLKVLKGLKFANKSPNPILGTRTIRISLVDSTECTQLIGGTVVVEPDEAVTQLVARQLKKTFALLPRDTFDTLDPRVALPPFTFLFPEAKLTNQDTDYFLGGSIVIKIEGGSPGDIVGVAMPSLRNVYASNEEVAPRRESAVFSSFHTTVNGTVSEAAAIQVLNDGRIQYLGEVVGKVRLGYICKVPATQGEDGGWFKSTDGTAPAASPATPTPPSAAAGAGASTTKLIIDFPREGAGCRIVAVEAMLHRIVYTSATPASNERGTPTQPGGPRTVKLDIALGPSKGKVNLDRMVVIPYARQPPVTIPVTCSTKLQLTLLPGLLIPSTAQSTSMSTASSKDASKGANASAGVFKYTERSGPLRIPSVDLPKDLDEFNKVTFIAEVVNPSGTKRKGQTPLADTEQFTLLSTDFELCPAVSSGGRIDRAHSGISTLAHLSHTSGNTLVGSGKMGRTASLRPGGAEVPHAASASLLSFPAGAGRRESVSVQRLGKQSGGETPAGSKSAANLVPGINSPAEGWGAMKRTSTSRSPMVVSLESPRKQSLPTVESRPASPGRSRGDSSAVTRTASQRELAGLIQTSNLGLPFRSSTSISPAASSSPIVAAEPNRVSPTTSKDQMEGKLAFVDPLEAKFEAPLFESWIAAFREKDEKDKAQRATLGYDERLPTYSRTTEPSLVVTGTIVEKQSRKVVGGFIAEAGKLTVNIKQMAKKELQSLLRGIVFGNCSEVTDHRNLKGFLRLAFFDGVSAVSQLLYPFTYDYVEKNPTIVALEGIRSTAPRMPFRLGWDDTLLRQFNMDSTHTDSSSNLPAIGAAANWRQAKIGKYPVAPFGTSSIDSKGSELPAVCRLLFTLYAPVPFGNAGRSLDAATDSWLTPLTIDEQARSSALFEQLSTMNSSSGANPESLHALRAKVPKGFVLDFDEEDHLIYISNSNTSRSSASTAAAGGGAARMARSESAMQDSMQMSRTDSMKDKESATLIPLRSTVGPSGPFDDSLLGQPHASIIQEASGLSDDNSTSVNDRDEEAEHLTAFLKFYFGKPIGRWRTVAVPPTTEEKSPAGNAPAQTGRSPAVNTALGAPHSCLEMVLFQESLLGSHGFQTAAAASGSASNQSALLDVNRHPACTSSDRERLLSYCLNCVSFAPPRGGKARSPQQGRLSPPSDPLSGYTSSSSLAPSSREASNGVPTGDWTVRVELDNGSSASTEASPLIPTHTPSSPDGPQAPSAHLIRTVLSKQDFTVTVLPPTVSPKVTEHGRSPSISPRSRSDSAPDTPPEGNLTRTGSLRRVGVAQLAVFRKLASPFPEGEAAFIQVLDR